MLTLDLIRHGATDWNRERRIQGQLDVPLSPEGRAQVRRLAERLAMAASTGDRVGDQAITDPSFRPQLIIASDLSRARETAASLAERLGLPLELDPRWRERDLGALQGQLWDEVERATPDALIAPPEGEPRDQQRARVEAAIGELRARYPAGRVLVVTHGGCIRAALEACLGEEISPWVPNTSITRLRHTAGWWRLVVVGDAAHLEGLQDGRRDAPRDTRP